MNALNPSRAYLPKLNPAPATILDHLDERFPGVGRDVWIERLERGTVRTAAGRIITARTPYAHGLTITYYRETIDEPETPFDERIVYRDERILIADKPHGLPVVPTGPYVNRTLLARLRRSTGLEDLSPIHRLDMETAGLVLFVVRPELRRLYHQLFEAAAVEKEYIAIAHAPQPIAEREWMVENRLGPGEPWFRLTIVEGEPNAATRIVLLEQRDGLGLFRLVPRTGKKHQLRIHLASLGFPILNDRFYPTVLPETPQDRDRPLQLLARRLAFRDPVTGEETAFESERELEGLRGH